jgi:hypothetical protein
MDKIDQRLTMLEHGLSTLFTHWKRMVNEVESIKAEIKLDREKQKALREEEEFKRERGILK